ncbi:hypothetical protein DM785_02360 [Deinococcus actinosclerus]|nr:hypothetical protein DM785_02360 [Deinococcus actinosclerus]
MPRSERLPPHVAAELTLIHALRLKDVHVSSVKQAIQRGHLTDDDWCDVLNLWISWGPKPRKPQTPRHIHDRIRARRAAGESIPSLFRYYGDRARIIKEHP